MLGLLALGLVDSAKPHPRQCIRMDTSDEAATLKPSAAGAPSALLLLARDYFGNVRFTGGDNSRRAARPERLAKCHDLGNGLYEIIYEPKANGEYMLEVSPRAEPVLGSPFAFRVPRPRPRPRCASRAESI